MAEEKKDVSFGITSSEAKAKATNSTTEDRVVFVKPAQTGKVGKIFLNGDQYGGGGDAENEKLGDNSTTTKQYTIPKGTDLSNMSALDILKKMLFATYVPHFADCGVSTSAKYTFKEDDNTDASKRTLIAKDQTSGIYVIAGTTTAPHKLHVTANISATGNKAEARASVNGTSATAASDKVAYGGAMDKIKVNGTEKEIFTDLANGVNRTIEVNKVGPFSTESFLTITDCHFTAGTTKVQNSVGEPTNVVSETSYGAETGTASSRITLPSETNGNTSLEYTIKEKTITPDPNTFKAAAYGYLPIYHSNAMELYGTPATAAPSGTLPSGSDKAVTNMAVSGNVVSYSTPVSNSIAYTIETGGKYYFKFKMPDASSTKPWQILVPKTLKLCNFYVTGPDGKSWGAANDMMKELDTDITIHGYVYHKWVTKDENGGSKQPMAFMICNK